MKFANVIVDISHEKLDRPFGYIIPDELEKEIKRTEAVTKIAKNIIDNGVLVLSVKKHLDEYGAGDKYEIPLLGASEK